MTQPLCLSTAVVTILVFTAGCGADGVYQRTIKLDRPLPEQAVGEALRRTPGIIAANAGQADSAEGYWTLVVDTGVGSDSTSNEVAFGWAKLTSEPPEVRVRLEGARLAPQRWRPIAASLVDRMSESLRQASSDFP